MYVGIPRSIGRLFFPSELNIFLMRHQTTLNWQSYDFSGFQSLLRKLETDQFQDRLAPGAISQASEGKCTMVVCCHRMVSLSWHSCRSPSNLIYSTIFLWFFYIHDTSRRWPYTLPITWKLIIFLENKPAVVYRSVRYRYRVGTRVLRVGLCGLFTPHLMTQFD